mmetsp:Transcript_7507/g.15023  ORF Transcript_7507/g.15023 Transcript_7507/m.15023 type:complete len:122 (-) Transcript_7507:1592-1957(-)
MTSSITNCEGSSAEGRSSSSSSQSMSATTIEAPPVPVPAAIGIGTPPSDGASAPAAKAAPEMDELIEKTDKSESALKSFLSGGVGGESTNLVRTSHRYVCVCFNITYCMTQGAIFSTLCFY